MPHPEQKNTMKYVIVIPDGCADEPVAALGGRTALQAARLPHIDALGQAGVVGLSDNVPPTLTAASDVATLSLLGYDPLEVYTGRAPLEAAAMGIPLGPNDWAIRCNLVHASQGNMTDFTSGHITSEDGRQLIEALQQTLGGPVAEGLDHPAGTLEFHPGVSYRNLLVFRGRPGASPFGLTTKTQPPHDVPDRPLADHLPNGPGSGFLRSLMEKSKLIFANHEVNKARRAKGLRDATQCWLWGQGVAPRLEPFATKYRKKGAMISAVDLVRGVGCLIGFTRIDVPGATGYLDTDYAAKGRYAIEALKHHDVVCVHVEAPDEASHEGNAAAKVEALERIDTDIVGPIIEGLRAYPKWRILITPDHRTTLATRAHAHGAVPFVVSGTGVLGLGQLGYTESVASQSPVSIGRGHRLMGHFLADTFPSGLIES